MPANCMLASVATTTIRVDRETHEQLVELSRASGTPLIDTVREAARALRRQRLAQRVATEVDELRRHRDAWNEYVADAESTSVTDGVE